MPLNIVMTGPPRSGKTHLTNIIIAATSLTDTQLNSTVTLYASLKHLQNLAFAFPIRNKYSVAVIEGVNTIDDIEEAYHLINKEYPRIALRIFHSQVQLSPDRIKYNHINFFTPQQ